MAAVAPASEREREKDVCADAGFPLSQPSNRTRKSLREKEEGKKKERTSKRKKENSLSQVQGSAMFDSDG